MMEAMKKAMTSVSNERVKQVNYPNEESSEMQTLAVNRMPSRFVCPGWWRNKFIGNSNIIYQIAMQLKIKTWMEEGIHEVK